MQLNFKKALILLFLVLLLGGFLRLYKLGRQSFIADEYLGINASYGYYKTGQWKFWDFNKEKLTDESYTRANIYYWQVAQVFKFLPANEANARLVSVVWGMIGIISIFVVSYLVTKNYWIALLAALLMSISVSSLMYDRKLRMYSMFVPIFLWFCYAVFYFLESTPRKAPKLIEKLSAKTGLNWQWFLPAIVLGVISFLTHALTVNIIAPVVVYLTLMLVINWKKNRKIEARYLFLFLITILAIIIALNLDKFQMHLSFFSWGINNWSYLEKVTLDYSHMLLAGVFFLIGCFHLIKHHSKIGLWTVVSYLSILFLAIMCWKRSAGHQYILLTQSFKIIIMASGIYFTAKILAEKVFSGSKKWFLGLIALFLVLLINFSFFFSKDSFYAEITKWNHSNYREIFSYYLRHREDNSAIITRPAANFYLWGTNTNIIGYNENEEELTLEKVKSAQENYDDVWVVFSGTMYIKGEARKYIRENFEKLETKYTNDKLDVWRWRKKTINNS
jgi:hypothetical protein